MKQRTKEEFMARFRGVPPHKVARALTALTPGFNFNGCSKGHLAEAWVRSLTNHGYERLRRVELDQIEAKIKDIYPE
jgi:hypothetical protein